MSGKCHICGAEDVELLAYDDLPLCDYCYHELKMGIDMFIKEKVLAMKGDKREKIRLTKSRQVEGQMSFV